MAGCQGERPDRTAEPSTPAEPSTGESAPAESSTVATATNGATAVAVDEEAPIRFRTSEPEPPQMDEASRDALAREAAPSDDQPTIEPPEFVEFYLPFYPLSARMEGIEGEVILAFTINENGRVVEPRIHSSTEPRFNGFALEAARDWRFRPVRINGEPVPIEIQYPVYFISEYGSGWLEADSPLATLVFLDGRYYRVGERPRYRLAEAEVTPIHREMPRYPDAFDEERVAGRVVLAFTVTEEGKVREPEVVESSHAEFEQSALTAIRYWQFLPRIRNGEPRVSRVQIPILFTPAEC
ncbi:MAG: energy transducer TonB [Puniceicoccaceae bacterium]|nr:MAG: energy transducer TonB [Puniceicoccaceae bacterium]